MNNNNKKSAVHGPAAAVTRGVCIRDAYESKPRRNVLGKSMLTMKSYEVSTPDHARGSRVVADHLVRLQLTQQYGKLLF